MKKSICELSRIENRRDESWRRHALECPDCRELKVVADWMTDLASASKSGRELPSAGFLLAKARIQKGLADADRAARPITAMVVLAGILLTGITAWVLTSDSNVGSVMVEGIRLFASYAGAMLIAAVTIAVVWGFSAYVWRDSHS